MAANGEREADSAPAAREERVLTAVNRVFRERLNCRTEEDLAKTCLAVAEELTGSKFGFIGELTSDGRFDTIALSDPGWDACKMPGSEVSMLIKGMEVRGIWGRAIREEKSQIANDPAGDPDRVGMPEGHPPLKAVLGVPLKHAGKTFGMIALGNKEGGYGGEDQKAVESLSVAIVEALRSKRIEDRLVRQTEELKRSNEELEQFAYVVSHDLQEPLRSINGFVQLLARRRREVKDEKSEHYTERIVAGVGRMRELIDDLLEYSRVSTRGNLFEPVDCGEIVTEALANLESAIDKSEAAVTCDEFPRVQGDASQLTQLFQNLIGNALKFRNERAPQIHINAEKRDGVWVFSVRDNGIGIEPQYFERIFHVFQRLHSQQEYAGTGIGLAICKKIAERHGGRIWVESEPGKGSTFNFTIPEREMVHRESRE
jgi:signal transduction histidine kinase